MIREGSTVQWKWGNGTAKGEVKESTLKKLPKQLTVAKLPEKEKKAIKRF